MDEQQKKDIEATLERSRRVVAESEALLEAMERRMDETDRFLESQGLTREQLEKLTFTDEQKEMVNVELQRRGMPKIDYEDDSGWKADPVDTARVDSARKMPRPSAGDEPDDFAARQARFRAMMSPIRL